MLRLLGAAFAALLTACSLVTLNASGEEDGDTLCLLQRDVMHSMPPMPQKRPLAEQDPRPHWVLMPPGMDELKKQNVHVVPADQFGNPVTHTGPCEDPFCWGKERTARHLATDYYIQTKQKKVLKEYKQESEALIAEAVRWRNQAMLAEVETRQLEAGISEMNATRQKMQEKKTMKSKKFVANPQNNTVKTWDFHNKEVSVANSMIAPKENEVGVKEEIMNLRQYTEKMQAVIEQISLNKKRLEEQIKKMQEKMVGMSARNEALHNKFTQLSMDKMHLQQELDSFKDLVKEELQKSSFAANTTGKLSEASSALRKKIMKLTAGSSTCEKQLAELKQFIEEQLLYSTVSAAQKAYTQEPNVQDKSNDTPVNANQHMQDAPMQISQKAEGTDASFWKKTAETLMAKTLPLEETIDKLSNENKMLFIKNKRLHNAVEQRKWH